jgi:hypothetical protein
MTYDQMPLKMWTLDRNHLGPILRPSYDVRKTIVTVLVGVNGMGRVKILTEGQKVMSEYFKDEIRRAIYSGALGDWRLRRPIHLTLHFNNAPVHNASVSV